MEERLTQLLKEALESERTGDFQEAVNAYMKAIDLKPQDVRLYKALAKAAYLLGAPILAVHSHLCTAHLNLHKLYEQLANDEASEDYLHYYDALPEDLKRILPHKAAGAIFNDFYLLKHLGHALIDLDPKRPEELAHSIDIYSSQIDGRKGYEHLYEKYNTSQEAMDELDQSHYIPVALNFIMEHIEWDALGSADVFPLYFSEEKINEKYGIEDEEKAEEDTE